MPYPTQSPPDPADLPAPVGEVPPTLVAVPAQAREVLSGARVDLSVLDDSLVVARLEEARQAMRDLAGTLEYAADRMRRLGQVFDDSVDEIGGCP